VEPPRSAPLKWMTKSEAGAEPSPPAASRRDFLTKMGFSLTAATMAACSRAPVEKAIPLLVQPEELTPGVAAWYATTCGGCSAACALLVKTRDGRPIKIEGNAQAPLTGGGTCASGQAQVLSLYDEERLRGPLWQGESTSWSALDARIADRLAAAARNRRRIVLLTGTLVSPATRSIVEAWRARYPTCRHITYDAMSCAAMRLANLESFGLGIIPHYRFDKARTIVSFGADFLGAWLSPVEFAHQYASVRKPESPWMARHVQIESWLSLTGANADLRLAVTPSEEGLVAAELLLRILRRTGATHDVTLPRSSVDAAALDGLAEDLWRNRGASLVVAGANDVALQTVVNALNARLGNIPETVEFHRAVAQKQGDDREMAALVEQMKAGEIDVLVMYGVNPAYDHPDAAGFVEGLRHVGLSVSLADRLDETASLAGAVCPDHHFLEAWNDAEPVAGALSLAQPTIAPLFDTRAAQDSLLAWMGE
jgi:molybdopterin-containing oxidoreductase family iron-sulfur binding subunit